MPFIRDNGAQFDAEDGEGVGEVQTKISQTLSSVYSQKRKYPFKAFKRFWTKKVGEKGVKVFSYGFGV